jgi:hypothetical protein
MRRCVLTFMALVIPEGYAHVVHSLSWAGDTELMAITYGVKAATVGAPATPAEIAATCNGAFGTNVMPEMDGIITLVGTEVTWQADPLPADPLIGSVSASVAGGGTSGSVVPQNTAFLVHKRTATGGRGGRGRFYLPGVDESAVSDLGIVATLVRTDFNTALQAMLDDLNAGGFTEGMYVLHDSLGAFAAADPYLVTSLTMDTLVSTQRRRLRK